MTVTDSGLKLNTTEYDRLKSKLNLIIEFIASVYTIGFKCHRLICKVGFACFSDRVTVVVEFCSFPGQRTSSASLHKAGRYCEGKIKMASEEVSRKMALEISAFVYNAHDFANNHW